MVEGPMLLESAKKGNVGLMARIFEECKKLDVSPKDGLGNTPLHYSVQGGHVGTAPMMNSNSNSNQDHHQVVDWVCVCERRYVAYAA